MRLSMLCFVALCVVPLSGCSILYGIHGRVRLTTAGAFKSELSLFLTKAGFVQDGSSFRFVYDASEVKTIGLWAHYVHDDSEFRFFVGKHNDPALSTREAEAMNAVAGFLAQRAGQLADVSLNGRVEKLANAQVLRDRVR